MSRSGLAGPPASLTTGMSYGVPPLLKFGSKQLQERFLPDLLLGKKRTCIAITEPEAGSDVANIQTTAAKTPDGKHYIVNGTKKWYGEPIDSPFSPIDLLFIHFIVFLFWYFSMCRYSPCPSIFWSFLLHYYLTIY